MVRRRTLLLAAAAACAPLAALVYVLAVDAPPVQRADAHVLAGFVGLSGRHSRLLATHVAQLVDPAMFAVLAASVVAIGLLRGQLRAAIAAGVAIVGANLTTQVLKPLLATQRPQVHGAAIDAAAWPSGHTTAAMSLALALVLVSAPRLRPLAAAGGGLLVAGVVYSILLLGWHYPSDVVGGFLVALAWTCAAAAALVGRRAAGAPIAARAAIGPPALVTGGLAAAIGVVGLSRLERALPYAAAHTTFVAGAAALGAGAVALATAVSLALSSSGAGPPRQAASDPRTRPGRPARS
jgi:membrane-associated phospholipid phosphatase